MNALKTLVALVALTASCHVLAATAPSAAGAPHPTVETAFAAWDTNHDGALSRDEFRVGWEQAQRALQTQASLRQRFASLDANRDGALDGDEYAGLDLVKAAGAAAPLSRFDGNKDGKLEFGEYLRLVQALASAGAGKAS